MPKPTAPGHPGISPTWSSSDKDMVLTALGSSRVWATLGHGILNEVYWPSTGRPQTRDLGFIVAHEGGWTELKRADAYRFSMPAADLPMPQIVHETEHFRLELEILCHPLRDAVLVRYALSGNARLFVLLAPHLDGDGHNTAVAGIDLAAHHADTALCLRADGGFARTSAGFVGVSDGWQDFHQNGAMTWAYGSAEDGNVALVGELASNAGILALAFAETPEGARTLARSSLADDFSNVREQFCAGWHNWAQALRLPDADPALCEMAQRSAMVIKVHEDRTYAGAVVASLSVPWGSSHDDAGGYHLVWTRDTVEAAFAMITVGQVEDAARTLNYLIGTQADDGSWAQNYFPDGRGYWTGRQMDEVALPVLLAAKLRAIGNPIPSAQERDMVRAALCFMAQNGPMSDQDRWEENAGASPFTLAVLIAALVTSADCFAGADKDYILSMADYWNERIEDWTFTRRGRLGAGLGIDGYYIRLSPRPADGGIDGDVPVRNVSTAPVPAGDLIGLEFLYLVRTGLRRADDPRIVDSVRLIDTLLRRETPVGPSFYRYNGDGYGEHEDGSAYDGTGVGRLWPLLTGERGHYAALAGEPVEPYLNAMTRMVGWGGLIPEQIWDGAAIPAHGLAPGRPTGSAMPLVWAHGEFLKLLCTHTQGRPVELFDAVVERYGGHPPAAAIWHWRQDTPFDTMPSGRSLCVEAREPFVLHFSLDGWTDTAERRSERNGLGVHVVPISADELRDTAAVRFTWHDADGNWIGRDYRIDLGG